MNDDDVPEYFTNSGKYATFRPSGTFTFERLVERIDNALEYCERNNIRKLLVNILEVEGVPPPSVIQRFYFATKWANTAAGHVALAMVAPDEMVDKEKIGVTMALNRGLQTDVFSTEEAADKWLSSIGNRR